MSLSSNSVLWAVMAYTLAIATSSLLLRFFPVVRRNLEHTQKIATPVWMGYAAI